PAEVRKNIAKTIWCHNDIEAFRFLKQFVGGIIDIKQRHFDSGIPSDIQRTCAPKRMDAWETGVLADHREDVSPSLRRCDRYAHYGSHLLFGVNKRVQDLPTIFGGRFCGIALISALQIFAHNQNVERFGRNSYSAHLAQFWIRAQRVEFVVKLEPTPHIINKSTACRTGHDRAALREDLVAKLRYLIGKIFASALS